MYTKSFKAWLNEGRDAFRVLLLLQQAVIDPPEGSYDTVSPAKAHSIAKEFIDYTQLAPLPAPNVLKFTDAGTGEANNSHACVLWVSGEVTNGQQKLTFRVEVTVSNVLRVIIDDDISDVFWKVQTAFDFIKEHVS